MRLLLIRHGQTPANVRGELDTGRPGPGLTELGRQQAAAVPGALAAERLDGIYVSSLIRTHQTAAPLADARAMAPIVLPGIHEIEAGDLEGRTDKESVTRYLETVWSWGSGSLGVRMPGAGDGREFFERFDSDVERVVSEHDAAATVAVFSHGASIRVWTAARAHNVPPEFPGRQHLDNTGVVTLEGSPLDGWRLVSWAGDPLGGSALVDLNAADITGDTTHDAIEEAD